MTRESIQQVFARLSKSPFRSRFALERSDYQTLSKKGLETIRQHAEELISNRLALASPKNDGKQTPWRGHPVFVAQHATATCCRSCLEKWHGIEKGVKLSCEQQKYLVQLIMAWLEQRLKKGIGDRSAPSQKTIDSNGKVRDQTDSLEQGSPQIQKELF